MPTNAYVTIGKHGAYEVTNHSSASFKASLNSNNILIYTLCLTDYLNTVHLLSDVLAPQEKARAQRYYHESDKNRFVICRALLKLLLSFHTQLPISKIKLNYDHNKKPYLPSHPSLFFNVSHSKEQAVIALSYRVIGVDIEYINDNEDILNNLATIYDEIEIASILNTKEKHLAFYKLWTRKEALVKAIGKGIDDDFPKIPSINGIHNMDTELLGSKENWNVEDIRIASNYMVAVAFVDNKSKPETLVLTTLPKNIKDIIS